MTLGILENILDRLTKIEAMLVNTAYIAAIDEAAVLESYRPAKVEPAKVEPAKVEPAKVEPDIQPEPTITLAVIKQTITRHITALSEADANIFRDQAVAAVQEVSGQAKLSGISVDQIEPLIAALARRGVELEWVA